MTPQPSGYAVSQRPGLRAVPVMARDRDGARKHRHRCRALGLAVSVLAVAGGATRARAQPRRWDLRVDAPAGASCLDSAELSRRIEARAGHGPDAAEVGEVRIVVQLRRTQQLATAHWRARVIAVDDRGRPLGTRELGLEQNDCHALDEALVLVVAAVVGVRPEQPAEPEPPAPPPTPSRTRERAAPVSFAVSRAPAARTEPSVEPRRSADAPDEPGEPWQFELGLTGRAVSGLMPGPAAGLSAGLIAHSGSLQFFGAALWVPHGSERVGARGESRFSAALAELGVCAVAARPSGGTFSFCAGAQGGAIWGRASGLWMQRPSQQPLLQATPGVLALFPLSQRLRLQTGVGAAFPVIYPRYSYLDEAGQRRTYHIVEMGLWAELGAALRVGQ